MVRAIMKDVLFLKKKAVPATKDDMPVVQDLLDTLKANETGCVGMAANMIGVKKNIMISTGKNSVRNYLDGQHKSVSMKLIICQVGLSNGNRRWEKIICKYLLMQMHVQ